MNAKLSELKPCPYRYGIAKKGRILFECRYAGETYDVLEMVEICNNFCPFSRGVFWIWNTFGRRR